MIRQRLIKAILIALAISLPATGARADLVLSQLVVEIVPSGTARSDIEIWNRGSDRAYVDASAREILNPGTPVQRATTSPDPAELGLLVSPSQMILEPGQRRLLRIAAISPSAERERVYRVTVKPVVGGLSAETSALKVLIGYDLLVIVRPSRLNPHVSGTRADRHLILSNDGNASVELVDGRECVKDSDRCSSLPDLRLYSGAKTTVDVAGNGPVSYKAKVSGKILSYKF